MLGTSGMVTSAMSGGPGVETHTTLSAARCRARVHRLQYFCRRRVWAAGVEGRFRSIFQAELDHFRRARPAQLRDKGQHEIDACRDAAPGQDVAVPDDAALSTMAPKTGSNSRHAQWQAARRPRRKPAAPKMSDPVKSRWVTPSYTGITTLIGCDIAGPPWGHARAGTI